jgi:hypothetical protein
MSLISLIYAYLYVGWLSLTVLLLNTFSSSILVMENINRWMSGEKNKGAGSFPEKFSQIIFFLNFVIK